jgi:hypothetical protein
MNETTPTALLVERAAHGDAAAWTEILDRYGPVVRAVIGTISGLCPADTADAVQTRGFACSSEREPSETRRRSLAGWPPPPAGKASPFAGADGSKQASAQLARTRPRRMPHPKQR